MSVATVASMIACGVNSEESPESPFGSKHVILPYDAYHARHPTSVKSQEYRLADLPYHGNMENISFTNRCGEILSVGVWCCSRQKCHFLYVNPFVPATLHILFDRSCNKCLNQSWKLSMFSMWMFSGTLRPAIETIETIACFSHDVSSRLPTQFHVE